MTACETFPAGLLVGQDEYGRQLHNGISLPDSDEPNSAEQLYRQWTQICLDYSACFLTKEEDKLVALSGIAQEFSQSLSSDVYLAGLWKNNLPHNLLWRVRHKDGLPIQSNSEPARKPCAYRAPSWSWLSLDGSIFYEWEADEKAYRIFANIISAKVDLVTKNVTGQIKGGYIKLRGCIRLANWHRVPNSYGNGYSIKLILDGRTSEQICEDRGDYSRQQDWIYCFQDIGLGFDNETVCCLIVGGNNTQDGPTLHGLLLIPTDTPKTYQRVGVFSIRGDGPCNALKYPLRKADIAGAFPWRNHSLKRKRSIPNVTTRLQASIDTVPKEHGQGVGAAADLAGHRNHSKDPGSPENLYRDAWPVNRQVFQKLEIQTITII